MQLGGLHAKSMQRLWVLQNSAARVITRTRKFQHITPVRAALHWRPVSFRIDFKILSLDFKSLHGDGPSYLPELLSPLESPRLMRSYSRSLLAVPRTRLCTVGNRAFCSIASHLWNGLPGHLRRPIQVYLLRVSSGNGILWTAGLTQNDRATQRAIV